MAKKYKIKFPIGDWSSDGHSHCIWYLVQSDLPVEQIRESHFSFSDMYGIDIGEIANNDHLDEMDDEEYELICRIASPEYKKNWIPSEKTEHDHIIQGPDHMIDIWIECLNHINPGLNLKHIPEKQYETINFYGFDEKKRHLKTPGYGLFD